MDYRKQMARPLSKHFADNICKEVLSSPADFATVYQLIFDKDEKVAWRAAWVCQKISEKNARWFSDEHYEELANYAISISHGGLQRGCLSILKNLPLPDSVSVDFINACFAWMVSPKSPVSVQALSMKILCKICEKMPDFIPELLICLDNIDIENYTAGFVSTRKNIIKRLTIKV